MAVSHPLLPPLGLVPLNNEFQRNQSQEKYLTGSFSTGKCSGSSSNCHTKRLRTNFKLPVKSPPGIIQFTSNLTDPPRGDSAYLCNLTDGIPYCQFFRDLPFQRRKRIQPVGEITTESCLFGDRSPLIFHDEFKPFAALCAIIQSVYLQTMPLPSSLREYTAGIQTRSNLSTGPNLCDSISRQC